jgi:hypothetical protein
VPYAGLPVFACPGTGYEPPSPYRSVQGRTEASQEVPTVEIGLPEKIIEVDPIEFPEDVPVEQPARERRPEQEPVGVPA